MSRKIFSLEGLIGCGKSTLLRKIQVRLPSGCIVVEEPVSKYSSFKDYNPLQMFYENPNENAVMMQVHIILALFKHYESKLKDSHELVVCERSMFSPVLFTKAMQRVGYISKFSAERLTDFVNVEIQKLLPKHPFGVDKMLYIECPIQECFNRIKTRDRLAEEHLSKNNFYKYMECLSSVYDMHKIDFIKLNGNDSVCSINYDDINLLEKCLTFFGIKAS